MIDILGLNHILDSRVETISGGELKRLSVACEILLGRSLVGFDEPTTGLSAKESLCICQTLRSLANQQIGVIASIHQPRSGILKFFDYVMVLSAGEIIFYGKREDMVPFFSQFLPQSSIDFSEMNEAEFACTILFLRCLI